MRPFEMAHALKDHPLLQMPALIDLAERLAATADSEDDGDIGIDHGVIESREMKTGSPHRRDYAARLMRFMDQADSTITMRRIERIDGYRQIMEAIVLEALLLAGDDCMELLHRIETFEAILLVTSPNRTTEYHVDPYCSWIFQIHGSKSIHLFDSSDKEVISDQELERIYAVDSRALRYKPELESRATVMQIDPGTAAHIPVDTPHWLQNGAGLSVSLVILFHFRDAAHASLYRANHMLRRVGLRPAPPGRHPRRDRIKALTAAMARRAARRLTSRPVQLSRQAIEERRRIAALIASRCGA